MSIVYLNGDYIEQQDAKISIMDRGLLFGDGVYEVIVVYHSTPFLLNEHLERLTRSLAGIALELDDSLKESLPQIVKQLIDLNGGGDLQLYLQITRGNYSSRKHDLPEKPLPTIFAFCMFNPLPDYAQLSRGINAITAADTRWKHCYIKAITLLPNILINHQAAQQGAQEAILINHGHAIEGVASNLFMVKNNVIMTPPPADDMLQGITRDLIIKLATLHHLSIEQRPITTAELFSADEIWLSNTTREIRPVIKLDNQPINDGKPGACWEKMYAILQEFKKNYV